jgi:hypothetical protein
MSSLPRPQVGDAVAYYFTYIDQVPDGDVLETLANELAATQRLLADLPAERETYRYAPGKWSIREVIGHVLDGERVFGYRAFHIARSGGGDVPSMDQDVFAAAAEADRRPLADLVAELAVVREGNLRLFRSLSAEAWERTGTASGNLFRVRAFPFILAGHERHHRQVLAAKYLG